MMQFLKTCLRRFFKTLFAVVLIAILAISYTYILAPWASRGRLYDNVVDTPETKIGLVFGTSNGNKNPYFRYRIDAAVRLWKAGKLKTLILSGDNRSRYYNEPETMKRDLVERGIPANRIVCDYAGLRTFDSVIRAKEIFGVKKIVFISQRFQNERAIYIAQANGIQAIGFNAQDVKSTQGLKTKFREIGARVKMWLDIHFLDTHPTHLGEKVRLPN
jgi:SanA protein